MKYGLNVAPPTSPICDSCEHLHCPPRSICGPSGLLWTIRFCLMALGSGLARLGGYPFEVRYSDGSLVRARAAADVAADAYVYFSRLLSGVEPSLAVIVAVSYTHLTLPTIYSV